LYKGRIPKGNPTNQGFGAQEKPSHRIHVYILFNYYLPNMKTHRKSTNSCRAYFTVRPMGWYFGNSFICKKIQEEPLIS